ncbi:MAG: hypothetical protein A3A13_01550, partial [Candidatus Yanofskybacteria bacterium RIFCSPLOWO2_01_FULL_43_22]
MKNIFGRQWFGKQSQNSIDWLLVASLVPILCAGLVTMNSFVGESTFFLRQIVWIAVSFFIFFLFSFIDFRFLRRTSVVVVLYGVAVFLLALLFIAGATFKGAQSWFDVGLFSIQPSDPAKIILIILLAKYFTRRHVEIAHVRHILISGAYALILFGLILVQPDFGSAIMIFVIWLGVVLFSGISKRHLLAVFFIAIAAFGALWTFGFEEYQKNRIRSFIHPLADLSGSGYNAYQSTIAIGSGELLGKGIGFGTQSRLKFLPEYETDFIFAAFAEEWGFVGVVFLFILYGIIIWRILENAMRGSSNFEMLYGAGIAVYL